MANNNLTFSLELKAVTAQFTAAVKQAKDGYEQASAAIRKESQQMGSSTNEAATALYKTLNLKPATALRDEINKIAQQLAEFKKNAGAPADETARVTAAARERVAQLKGELNGIAPAAQGAAAGVQSIGTSAQSVSSQIGNLKNQVAAFVGINLGAGMVKDAIATADAFNNLQARVKLATGAGEGFKQAFVDVSAIALRTGSNLEQTGILFARLTDAGKSAGLSTQAAITQSLKLTETISQAVQLSGGSAESSKAAITQLIQGLQSGVVRGEEFNSIMEQSPRLAKALAEGLGVTTGELRKMSEAGALSADVVIKAIKSQSATLKDEFGTLPATVGRAIENLQTRWSLYIGELDKSKGITSKVAEAVNLLANNLNTVISVLTTGAAVFSANAALQRLAGESSQAAAVKVAAQGVASTEAALATRAHGTAAGIAAGQVTGYGAAASAAGTAAGASSAGVVGRFAGLTGAVTGFLGKLGLIGTVAFAGFEVLKLAQEQALTPLLKKISGLAAAEKALADQQEKTKNTIQANKDALEALAAAKETATIKSFNLSKQAVVLAAGFDKARTSGDSAAEAIAKIGKDFDLSTIKGIKDAGGVLDKLLADGKITASEFEKAWSDALNGKDLMQFEVLAKTAFANVGRDGAQLAQAMDASVREAIKRTGLDFEIISGGMGKAARSAINDTDTIIAGLDKLKAKGVDVAQALTASIGNGIETAKTTEALEAVKRQIEQVRGKLGEVVTNGLLDQAAAKAVELKKKLEDITPGIQSVGEAFRRMGLKTREESAVTAKEFGEAFAIIEGSGKATVGQLQESFKKYAEAAIAANGGVSTSMLDARATALKLRITVDASGNAIITKLDDAANATDRLSNGFSNAGVAAESSADRSINALERQIAVQEKAIDLTRRQKAIDDAKKGVDSEGYSLDSSGKRAVASSQNKSEFIKEAISKGLSPQEALRLADESTQQVYNQGQASDFSGGKRTASGTVEVFNSNKFYAELEKAVLENLRKQSGGGNGGSSIGNIDRRAQPPQPIPFPTYEPINTGSTKTIEVRFVLEGRSVTAKIDANNENDFLEMLKKAKGVA